MAHQESDTTERLSLFTFKSKINDNITIQVYFSLCFPSLICPIKETTYLAIILCHLLSKDIFRAPSEKTWDCIFHLLSRKIAESLAQIKASIMLDEWVDGQWFGAHKQLPNIVIFYCTYEEMTSGRKINA